MQSVTSRIWTRVAVFISYNDNHYTIELDHNAVEATKNICRAKGEGAVDRNTVNRWFKKFHAGCKNLNEQARSDRPKSVDSDSKLQAVASNSATSTRRVPG